MPAPEWPEFRADPDAKIKFDLLSLSREQMKNLLETPLYAHQVNAMQQAILRGPEGPPGPMGPKGDKGEPGEPAVVKWVDHSNNPRQVGKSGKQPQDRKKPKKWSDESIDNQRDLLERAITLLENKTTLIGVLELQVDDMRQANDSLLKLIEDLQAKLADMDDRLNWLET